MTAIRIALDDDDRTVLAEFGVLDPSALGESISKLPAAHRELRAAHEQIGLLVLLWEVIEYGCATLSARQARLLAEFLWQDAKELHAAAREERELVPLASTTPAEYLEESESNVNSLADAFDAQAEVCARLLEQLAEGDV